MTMTVLQIFQKAMADYERGSLDSAESLARHLIKAKADFDGGHYLCALIALRRGEGRAAAKFLSRALAISPTQPVLHAAMARAQMMQNLVLAEGDGRGSVSDQAFPHVRT